MIAIHGWCDQKKSTADKEKSLDNNKPGHGEHRENKTSGKEETFRQDEEDR